MIQDPQAFLRANRPAVPSLPRLTVPAFGDETPTSNDCPKCKERPNVVFLNGLDCFGVIHDCDDKTSISYGQTRNDADARWIYRCLLVDPKTPYRFFVALGIFLVFCTWLGWK